MTLSEIVELWDYHHPNNKFWEVNRSLIPEPVDFDALVDYLMYNHVDSQTVYSESAVMHDQVNNFFKVHKWNIDKLAKSLTFQYDPIQNEWHTTDTDYFHDELDQTSTARTQHSGSERNKEGTEDEQTDYTRDDVTNETSREDTDYTRDDKTHEETKEDETTKVTTNTTTNEDKTQNTENETVHLVSAFNDQPSRLENLIDTEEWREVNPGSSVHDDNTITEKKTQDTTRNLTSTTDGTLDRHDVTGTDKTVDGSLDRDDSTARDLDTTEHESIQATEHEGREQATKEDEENHQTVFRHGMSGNTFQNLTEEERRQAQFNIYKWIDRHFSRECVLPIW